ncbi:MAG: lycopene cyclase family protein, partial [Candidatus Puniceispirillum sp.]
VQNGVTFHDSLDAAHLDRDAEIFDSRPPKVADGVMLQHFVGFEVRAAAGSFDDSTAILMDFRCDQSRGMHFI